jgi:hypothetical protein
MCYMVKNLLFQLSRAYQKKLRHVHPFGAGNHQHSSNRIGLSSNVLR